MTTDCGDDGGGLALLIRERLAPRDVSGLPLTDGPTVAATKWISSRTAALLRERGVGYIDATGNAEIRATTPALYVRTVGAARDPEPTPATAPGLRGPRAWALLRTLVEVDPPYGVRELSVALGLDADYVSRVLRVLEDELLISRRPRGPVTQIDWEGVLRHLATTYSLLDANDTSAWVAPDGAEQFVRDLPGRRAGRWAVTASFAPAAIAPIAPPESAVMYVDDSERVAKVGKVPRARTGANVILAAPYDPIVFQRNRRIDGVPQVSVTEVAADCLTGSGRMPEEGETVVGWMRHNPKRWQATTLRDSTANAP